MLDESYISVWVYIYNSTLYRKCNVPRESHVYIRLWKSRTLTCKVASVGCIGGVDGVVNARMAELLASRKM